MGVSTFGLLRDATGDEVRGDIDQLTAHGLLQQIGDPYPVLQLTARGVELMRTGRGDAPCALVRQRRPSEARLPAHVCPRVPPCVIFHDATRRELARLKPRTLDAMSGVHAMGERKIASFSTIVLDEIRAHG
jgi:ATP-dependent DNA helicase RecQ